jgi:hypothetical protein
LRSIAADDVPGRPGVDEDMHLNLNIGITIHTPECYTMYLAIVCPAEGGSANATEA